MKTELIAKMSRTLHRTGFKIKKHSPEILMAAGVVGVVTSGVMACKATTKLSDILESAKTDIDTIHHAVEHADELPEEYTPEDGQRDLTIIYVQTGVKLVKLYAPAVALGALSIASILGSHNILRKRNVALAAAYTAIDTGFKEYRGRVVERFGKDLDRELRYNIKAKEIEEVSYDENGQEVKTKKVVQVSDVNQYSDFARCFDAFNTDAWENDAEYNLMFLRNQQNFANDKLQSQGYLFLNDVYEMLGIPKTAAGQQVGWIYDLKHPNGDNYVDFGIYDITKEANRNFVNGYEKCVWIDPNVDGYILDKI